MGVRPACSACKRFVSGSNPIFFAENVRIPRPDAAVLASRAMRRPAVRGATLPAAAAALVFAAFFFSDGSSQSRVFWIGVAAVIVAAVGWALQPPQLSPAAGFFLAGLGAFVVWQGVSIAWSIQPSRSWDYTNRGL